MPRRRRGPRPGLGRAQNPQFPAISAQIIQNGLFGVSINFSVDVKVFGPIDLHVQPDGPGYAEIKVSTWVQNFPTSYSAVYRNQLRGRGYHLYAYPVNVTTTGGAGFVPVIGTFV